MTTHTEVEQLARPCGCVLRRPTQAEKDDMVFTAYGWVVERGCTEHPRAGRYVSQTDLDEDARKQWLAGLNPGDVVADEGGHYGSVIKRTVLRVTTTQIVVAGDARFRRSDGRLLKNARSPRRSLLRPWTQADTDKERLQILKSRLHYYQWEKLTLPQLEAVNSTLPDVEALDGDQKTD